MISWGIDPLIEETYINGGGLYSDVYCLKATDYPNINYGNCYSASGDTANAYPIINTNAIELHWKLPEFTNIPNDGT